ncbi:MFS transporter [Marinobacteraceae bacterium S3BR75-40.1]
MSDTVYPPASARWAWAFYDWANSAFFTIILTFVFARYFSQAVAESSVQGTNVWGNTVGVAGLFIAVGSPILGAIADQGGRRKPWLLFCTALCVLGSAMLWFVTPAASDLWFGAFWAGIGILGAEFAFVFYNAMLPDITPPEHIGRWSGWGWGLGYIGGVISLVLCLYGLIETRPGFLGLDHDQSEHIRATFILAAVWYAVFAIPLFLFTPDQPASGHPWRECIRAGLTQLGRSIRNVRRYGFILRFLVARMIYTDGLATIFAFGAVYAGGTFGLNQTEVLKFGILLNVTAGAGALAFGLIDDRLGGRNTVLVSLVGLMGCTVALLVVESLPLFWTFGLLLGIFVGPAQASSRSYLARVAPEHLRTEMFGLFAFSGKATAFAGPLLVGWVTAATDSQRWGMSTIAVFLAIGLILMLTVPRESHAAAPAPDPTSS